jgi:hypothetical protein
MAPRTPRLQARRGTAPPRPRQARGRCRWSCSGWRWTRTRSVARHDNTCAQSALLGLASAARCAARGAGRGARRGAEAGARGGRISLRPGAWARRCVCWRAALAPSACSPPPLCAPPALTAPRTARRCAPPRPVAAGAVETAGAVRAVTHWSCVPSEPSCAQSAIGLNGLQRQVTEHGGIARLVEYLSLEAQAARAGEPEASARPPPPLSLSCSLSLSLSL